MRSPQDSTRLPVWDQPCIHAAPVPGKLDQVLCTIGVEDSPAVSHCRDHCPMSVHPKVYREITIQTDDNRRMFQKAVAKKANQILEQKRGNKTGLGDIVESAIDIFTFGKAKKLMKAKEEKTGKPCGCKKRKEALNKIGEKIGLKSTGSNEEPRDAS